MKLPRDLSGVELARALAKAGYQITRQTGSHIRLTTELPSQHHVTIPAHESLKVGTLSSILGDVAAHLQIDREDLLKNCSTDMTKNRKVAAGNAGRDSAGGIARRPCIPRAVWLS